MAKLSSQQGAAALQEAIALHRQGQLAAAEKGYARILKSFPDQFDALHLLGLLKLQAGRAGEAQRLIASALKVNPGSPDALANLGSSFVAATIFALLGVVLFIVAFAIFNKLTPGTLWKELIEDQNVAMGNLMAGIAIALAIIIAAAIH